MEICLIRHGATPGNLEKRYIGVTDEPLSREGAAVLQACAARGFYPVVQTVFASPMCRCMETAGLIYPDVPPVTVRELRERGFGRLEGRNYRELSGDADYRAWIDSGGSLPFPGGESGAVFTERVMAGWRRILELAAGTERIAVITHGGCIMTILSETAGDPEKGFYDYQCGNGDFYLCVYEEGALRVGRKGVVSGL